MTGAFSRQLLRHEGPFFLLATATWWLVVSCAAESQNLQSHLLFALIASLVSFLALKFLGYFDVVRLHPRKSDLLLVLASMPLGGIVSVLLLSLSWHLPVMPMFVLLTWTPLLSLLIFGGHHVLASILINLRGKRKIVLSLAPTEVAALLKELSSSGLLQHFEFLTVAELKSYLDAGRHEEISLIALSKSGAGALSTDKTMLRAHLAGVPFTDVLKITSDLTGRTKLEDTDLWGYILSATPQTAMLRWYSHARGYLEPLFAALMLLVLSPLLIILAVAIRLSGPGPVLYRQKRTGYLDRPFILYKFRTMHPDSEQDGPQWSSATDMRVTRMGAFLRRTRLDELPQLWNVIRGEMSFIGPRPERPEMVAAVTESEPLFALRTTVRPGITGWAQVCAGYASTIEQSRVKLEYDLYYIQHISPRLDLIILIKTAKVVMCGEPHISASAVAAPAQPVTANL